MKRWTKSEPIDLTDYQPDERDKLTIFNIVSLGALILGCVLLACVALAANGQIPLMRGW
jgi:hypothetical protein